MNRALRFLHSGAMCRRLWLAAALIAALGACGKHRPDTPPSAAPRPSTTVMMADHVTTADLRLHARQKAPAAGWM